ncbi:MAG: tetratricopeptide repeat protein [Betaproteobacteria bacterium]
MSRLPLALCLTLMFCGPAAAADQEETFTVPDSGADYVDGKKLSRLMERADPKAATNIGWLYARGEGGVKQDFEEALKWWRFAASRGYTPAMNNIGLLYANGHGVAQAYEEAFKWWMRAAERGDGWAMNAVGDMYENGQGAPKSYELAMTWYREAAREGDSLGMWNVAHLLEEGLGTDRNPGEAVTWYRRSAENGYAPAMYGLGRLLESGQGADRDEVEAYALLSLAATRFTAEDAADARDNLQLLDRLKARLTPEQRAAGEQRKLVLGGQYRKPEKSKATDGSST